MGERLAAMGRNAIAGAIADRRRFPAKRQVTEALLDTFCLKHGTLDRLVAQ